MKMTTAHELAQHQTEVDWWIDELSGDPAHGHCGVDGCRDTPTVLLCFDGEIQSYLLCERHYREMRRMRRQAYGLRPMTL
jgi:hypothetical protein